MFFITVAQSSVTTGGLMAEVTIDMFYLKALLLFVRPWDCVTVTTTQLYINTMGRHNSRVAAP